jgi:hypothetical protein
MPFWRVMNQNIQSITMIPQLNLLQEKEFFKLAGFMLMGRFQVMNATVCTEHKGHATTKHGLIFHQLSYVGYNDAAKEMQLILQEVNLRSGDSGILQTSLSSFKTTLTYSGSLHS